MKPITQIFVDAKATSGVAILPYLTMGFPKPELSLPLLQALADSGADIIEVGIAHSDPVADGPVIQEASNKALENGASTEQVFSILTEFRQTHPETALVIMTYYNVVLQYGISQFIESALKLKVGGLIIPDLPYFEADDLHSQLKDTSMALIPLVSPNLPEEHLQKIAQSASGFIYLISVTGVTGARQELSSKALANAKKLRELTDLPLALGFGISSNQQVAQAAQNFDGVIVGSALIKAIAKAQDPVAAAATFMQNLRN